MTDPALDALWKEQKTLGPLVQVMPSDLWKMEEIPSFRKLALLTFTRPLCETDWIRFDFYASRIRVLGERVDDVLFPDPFPMIFLHESVLAAFSAFRPARQILPRLHTLTLTFGNEGSRMQESIPHLEILFAPSIKRLNISQYTVEANPELMQFFPSFSSLCPRLEYLHVDGGDRSDTTAIGQTILKMDHLRIINVASTIEMTHDLMLHLSALSTLQSLATIVIPSDDLTFRGVIPLIPGNFQNLRRLFFHTPTWSQAGSLLESFQCPLQKLSIELTRGDARLAPFLKTLARHPCITTLTHVRLIDRISTIDADPAEILRGLQVLSAMRGLEVLLIIHPCVRFLDDTWLLNISLACKGLQRLAIGDDHVDEQAEDARVQQPHMTLKGLVPLITNCPDIEQISIPIHAAPIDPAIFLHPPVCNTLVTYLLFKPATIIHPQKVFRSLITLFPRLETVIAHASSEEDQRGWAEVGKLVRSTNY
ncbi:hypothetical protein H0H93_016466 [Arthromyces matolae]|nr:hypothetical protein H0H93_016466 [Arthromyces matolae]